MGMSAFGGRLRGPPRPGTYDVAVGAGEGVGDGAGAMTWRLTANHRRALLLSGVCCLDTLRRTGCFLTRWGTGPRLGCNDTRGERMAVVDDVVVGCRHRASAVLAGQVCESSEVEGSGHSGRPDGRGRGAPVLQMSCKMRSKTAHRG